MVAKTKHFQPNNLSNDFLDTLLYEAYYYYDLPGLAVEIGSGSDGTAYRKSWGVKNIQTKEPLRPNDIFHMASLAKLFTGTGILKLWEQGMLDLDAPVAHYIKEFHLGDPLSDKITIRHLLSHTSGMPDVTDYHWDKPETDRDALMNYAISQEMGNTRLLWPPDENKFSYSNIGYDILGLVIDRVSGCSFEDYMRDALFEPLGLCHSTFFTPDRDLSEICAPHKKNPAKQTVVMPHYPYNRIHAPSSTLTSTIEDMGRWASLHLNRQVLSSESYRVAWTPVSTVPNNGEKICLSWFAREQNGAVLYGHEGSDDGFRSSLWLCPDLDAYVILCANISDAPLKKISKQIFGEICPQST